MDDDNILQEAIDALEQACDRLAENVPLWAAVTIYNYLSEENERLKTLLRATGLQEWIINDRPDLVDHNED